MDLERTICGMVDARCSVLKITYQDSGGENGFVAESGGGGEEKEEEGAGEEKKGWMR